MFRQPDPLKIFSHAQEADKAANISQQGYSKIISLYEEALVALEKALKSKEMENKTQLEHCLKTCIYRLQELQHMSSGKPTTYTQITATGLVGTGIGLLALGPYGALAGGVGAMLMATQNNKAGQIARGAGNVAMVTYEEAKAVKHNYQLVCHQTGSSHQAKKMVGTAAVGGGIGMLALGPYGALAGGLGAMYLTTQDNTPGEIARGTGAVAVALCKQGQAINNKYQVAEKGMNMIQVGARKAAGKCNR